MIWNENDIALICLKNPKFFFGNQRKLEYLPKILTKFEILTKYKNQSKMTIFQINSKIPLSNSSVTKILHNPYNSSQLISTCFSGEIHIWKLPNLKQYRKLTLNLAKLTTIVPFQNSNTRGFLLAVRNGELMTTNQNLEKITSKKGHTESISEIIISSKYVITIGLDGKVVFLNKNTLEQERKLQFEYPLLSGVEFDNKIYLSSIKSFAINIDTFEWTEGKRFDKFFVLQNSLYGCSDERGLSSVIQNSNNYIPAEFLLLYNRKIVIFSQKSICVANHFKKLQYKAKKYEQFSSGESITTGFVCENNIYVGGNQSNIYWISECCQKEERSPPFN